MEELKKILIKEVMVKKPYIIEVNDPFSKAWDMFREHSIRQLPVLDCNKKLKGIVTLKDLYRTLSPHKTLEGNIVYDKAQLDRFILKHVMTKKVITLDSLDTLGTAIEIMVRRKFACIPIVNKTGQLNGIITHIDVLRSINKYFL